jgi:hypothetical protein
VAQRVNNGDTMQPEKILVYLGTSLPLAKAREILPGAIYRAPAKQGDIVTDVVNLEPDRIILIDGNFDANLSVWHKEIVYALQYPGVKAVYGAASMGALRAAELDWLGMVGIGRVYEWYRAGITEDDSEVALSYAVRDGPDGPIYYTNTVPLVDIRAGVEHYEKEFPLEPVARAAREFLLDMARVYYGDRTESVCANSWDKNFGVNSRPELESKAFPQIPQKALDAIEALTNFRAYEPAPIQKPTPENLSRYFQALYERDRRIKVNGTEVPQQHVDAYVLLHNPEYERICWDSSNQDLALMLCDQLLVTVGIEEIERENVRFQQRSGIETLEDFRCFLENNGWSRPEYDRLMIQNARIRRLQHANTIARMYRRNTQSLIDYLRTHQAFDYWAIQAVAAEERIKASGVDDWLGINQKNSFELLAEHFEREGLDLRSNNEEYLLETGFSNLTELGVALARIAAGAAEKGNTQ